MKFSNLLAVAPSRDLHEALWRTAPARSTGAIAPASGRPHGKLWILVATLMIIAMIAIPALAADGCTQTSEPIETDRPDVTNSSVVIPVGSLQNENGVNLSRSNRGLVFDGTNSRLRLGIASCLEMLVDLPSYVASFSGPGPSGSTNVIPAIKWQISPVPGKFDLSVTAGAGLPTGANAIVGLGVQPYLQFPWSLALGSGWAATGMMANFLTPASSVNRYTNQSTFVIERQFGERAFLFAEYVGEFPMAGGASHLFNLGGGYRITLTQQIDFHTSVGLNRNAPAYIFGLGYSLRRDKLFE